MATLGVEEDGYVHPFIFVPCNGSNKIYYVLLPEFDYEGVLFDWIDLYNGKKISFPKLCPPDDEDFIYKEEIYF